MSVRREYMRTVKRFIILFFIIIIGLPLAIVGASLIKDATPPSYLEDVQIDEDETIDAEIKKEMDKYLMQFIMGNQKITIEEKKVNELIYKSQDGFKKIPNLNSLWVNFGEEKLTVYALIGYKNVSTTLTMRVDVGEENNQTKISLNTFKVGQLPIPKFLFTFLLNNYASDYIEKYDYGELNYDELYVTILSSYIQEQLEKTLEVDNDFLIFDNISFQDNKFMISCKLNPENTQGLALQNTIDELKGIIQDDEKLMNKLVGSEGVLDEDDPYEKQLSEDFKALQDIINNADTTSEVEQDVISS